MTDSDLILSAVDGDLDAFGALVERYQHVVYAVALSIVGEYSAAEDVAQETFLTAFTRLSQLRDPGSFPSWLRRIAVNAARMWLRNRKPGEALPETGLAATKVEGGLRSEVASALASLPEQKRQVAILCYLDGVKRREAALFFGVTEVTLRKRLHDAKRLLQRRIVKAAERAFEQHLLPKDFVRRCICGCELALDTEKRREADPMPEKEKRKKNEKDDCRCGCRPESAKKAEGDRKREKRAREDKA
ncbi:MAG: RNA polymerase sigma factor [Planctomycetota bacterium]|jgi:RNA polymerase sigma-70 factor (ECF subfamily)